MRIKSEVAPAEEHSPACREAGEPDMVWAQQIRDLPKVTGHCRRCGAVSTRMVSR